MLNSLALKIGLAALLVALLGISLYGMVSAKQETARLEQRLDLAEKAHQQAQERLKAAQATDAKQARVRLTEGRSVRQATTLAAQVALQEKPHAEGTSPDAESDADRVLLDAVTAANASLARTRDVR